MMSKPLDNNRHHMCGRPIIENNYDIGALTGWFCEKLPKHKEEGLSGALVGIDKKAKSGNIINGKP